MSDTNSAGDSPQILSALCLAHGVAPERARHAHRTGKLALVPVETGGRITYLCRPSELQRWLSSRSRRRAPAHEQIAAPTSASSIA